jgi:hypothetical protein
MAMDSNFKRFS